MADELSTEMDRLNELIAHVEVDFVTMGLVAPARVRLQTEDQGCVTRWLAMILQASAKCTEVSSATSESKYRQSTCDNGPYQSR